MTCTLSVPLQSAGLHEVEDVEPRSQAKRRAVPSTPNRSPDTMWPTGRSVRELALSGERPWSSIRFGV